MKKGLLIGCLICFGWFSNIQSKAQDSLSDRDSSFVAMLDTKLDLSASQKDEVISLYIRIAKEIKDLEAEKKSLNGSDLNEETLSLRLAVVNQQMKDVRQARKEELQLLLNPDQAKIYVEEISPDKPNVLHFGIHNRMDCRVCKE